jgi:acetyl-CoA carboxylase biotin carboxyl carrier protein
MTEQKDHDLETIKELIGIMRENDLLEIEIKHGDDKIFLKRSQGQPSVFAPVQVVPQAFPAGPQPPAVTAAGPAGPNSTQPAAPAMQAPAEAMVEIKSPLVGTFYAAPSPDSEPYVEVGSPVEPQTVVCIVEAMKVMNEIKADAAGKIVEILVENGQAVEYGQPLFKVRPE